MMITEAYNTEYGMYTTTHKTDAQYTQSHIHIAKVCEIREAKHGDEECVL